MAGPAPSVHYCRACGASLAERERICPRCGSELGAPTGLQSRMVFLPGRSSAALAKIAGLVWLGVGVASAAGSLVELVSGGTIVAWAAVSAGLELISGVALFVNPSWVVLTATTLWGALSVIGTLLLVAKGSGPGPTAYVLAAGIAVASAISFAARRRLEAQEQADEGG